MHMKISARRLSRLVFEVAKDVHGRFDTSDVDADMDAEDPSMVDPEAAFEIDEGLDDDRPWDTSDVEGHDDVEQEDVSHRSTADADEDDPQANVSYMLGELADGIAYLEQMIGSIEGSAVASERLYKLQMHVAAAIDEIERISSLDDER